MSKREKLLWITRTGLCVALLIVLQMATVPLGTPLITGSLVNLLLIVSVMTGGLWSGISVSVVSPVAAKLFGIGPLWALLPFIAAGNIVLVWFWHLLGNRLKGHKPYAVYLMVLTAAAIAKFLVLYVGVVQIAVPLLLQLPAPQAAAVSAMFSLPQLVTALAGGITAAVLLPRLQKAMGRGHK